MSVLPVFIYLCSFSRKKFIFNKISLFPAELKKTKVKEKKNVTLNL